MWQLQFVSIIYLNALDGRPPWQLSSLVSQSKDEVGSEEAGCRTPSDDVLDADSIDELLCPSAVPSRVPVLPGSKSQARTLSEAPRLSHGNGVAMRSYRPLVLRNAFGLLLNDSGSLGRIFLFWTVMGIDPWRRPMWTYAPRHWKSCPL